MGELGAALERPGLRALHPLSLPGPWVPALTLSPHRLWCFVVIGVGTRETRTKGHPVLMPFAPSQGSRL